MDLLIVLWGFFFWVELENFSYMGFLWWDLKSKGWVV